MEQEQKQHPEIERIALSMQRAAYDHHFTETVGDIRLLMEGGFCITVTHTPTKTEK